MMKPSKLRVTLGQIMALVAILALMFTMLGVVGGTIAIVSLGLLAWPIKLAPSSRKVEAWAWVVSLYPGWIFLSLCSSWLTTLIVLGDLPPRTAYLRPQPTPLIAGAWVSSRFLLFFLPISFVVCAFLTVAAAKARSLSDRESKPTPFLPLIWPALWLAGFTVLTCDPFRFVDSAFW
jgi:hypothetical protein